MNEILVGQGVHLRVITLKNRYVPDPYKIKSILPNKFKVQITSDFDLLFRMVAKDGVKML